MTQLLQQALTEVQKLPDSQQDAIASIILQEIADEHLWDESFAKSQNQLAAMAQKARNDISAGRVVNGGFDQL
jgi:hypothetical protein